MKLFQENRELKFVIVAFIVAVVFLFSVPFSGNFPLGDDPYYSQMVFNFMQGKFVFSISPVAATTLLHVLYGFLFSVIFGPLLHGFGPHAILRMSTMLLSVAYVLAAFFFGRLLKLSSIESLMLALLILTNPIFYNISHTFMTDISFSFLFLLALFFYLRGTQQQSSPRNSDLLIGSVFASAAILVRQWGITLPVGAFIALCVQKKRAPSLKEFLALFLAPVIAFALGMYWVYAVMGGLSSYFFPLKGLQYALRFSMIALNLAFYLFPLVLILPVFNASKPRRPLIFILVILAIVPFVVYEQLKHGWIFPFIQNSFGQSGAGMVYMAPAMTGEARQLAFAPWLLWLFLISSLALLAHLVSNLDAKSLKPAFHLLVMVVPYFLAMLVTSIFFDRYLIPLFPVLFFFVVRQMRGRRHGTALLVLTILIMASLSWYSNHNYLSLQQANWSAINFLLEQGIPREQIDGGIEFCTQNRFGGLIPKDAPSSGSVSGWCEGDDYVTSLEPIPNYDIMETISYNDGFGNSAAHIFVLKKSGLLSG